MSEQLELSPPSGPKTKVPGKAANTIAAYREWRKTTEGASVWEAFQVSALRQQNDGATRLGGKAIAEMVRVLLKVKLNNTYVSWLVDDLIARYPSMAWLFERRPRRKVA